MNVLGACLTIITTTVSIKANSVTETLPHSELCAVTAKESKERQSLRQSREQKTCWKITNKNGGNTSVHH